jgi:hypothetical protein
LVSWYKNVLFAEPPPFACDRIERKEWERCGFRRGFERRESKECGDATEASKSSGEEKKNASSVAHHHVKMVLFAILGVDVDLRREVTARVFLLEHGLGRHLGVSKVSLDVGVVDAAREHLLVVALGPHALALFAHDDGGAGVLAPGEDHPGGDVGVLEKLEGDETVVAGRLGVLEDVGELLQVARAEEMRDVRHALLRDEAERLGLNLEHALAHHLVHADVIGRDLAPGDVLGLGGLEELLVRERRRGGRVGRHGHEGVGGSRGAKPGEAPRGGAKRAGHRGRASRGAREEGGRERERRARRGVSSEEAGGEGFGRGDAQKSATPPSERNRFQSARRAPF